jgi:hypothetical protein
MTRNALRATLTRSTLYLYARRIAFLPMQTVRAANENGEA